MGENKIAKYNPFPPLLDQSMIWPEGSQDGHIAQVSVASALS